MIISLIAALSTYSNLIGINNSIPWHLPEDMQYFKNTTTGKTVIMGRKTFESMNSKPLPNRINIVVSNTLQPIEGILIAKNLNEAYELASKFCRRKEDEVFIIGGSSLYKEGLIRADRIYLTGIEIEVSDPKNEGVYFPEFNTSKYNLIWKGGETAEESKSKIAYDFWLYEKLPQFASY